MSGINAIYRIINEEQREEIVSNMNSQISHRGPDIQRTNSFGNCTLGVNMFSSRQSDSQPYINETGQVVLCCDANIFNFEELKKLLSARGHIFTTPDSEEVLLHLLEEFGPEGLTKINGYFAAVLYDNNSGTLTLLRDPFGVKPLYYCQLDDGLIISSELKGIVASKLFTPRPSYHSLNLFLHLQYPPEPESMVEHVYRLPGGQYINFDVRTSQVNVSQYYTLDFPKDNSLTLEDAVSKTQELFSESFQKLYPSSSTVGAFLSSGIDSASVAAYLSKHYGHIPTFSIGFQSAKFDELSHIREFSDELGLNNYQILLSPELILRNYQNYFWHLDEPVADPSAFGLFMAGELAGKYVSTVFSGEGADEFFGGYNIYQEPLELNKVSQIPDPFLKSGYLLLASLPGKIKGQNFLKRALTPLSNRYFGNSFIFSEQEKSKLIKKDWQKDRVLRSKFAPVYQQAISYDQVSTMQYIDMNIWMPGDISVKVDRMLMANSLELRAPFLDKDLCEFALTLPTSLKVSNKETKLTLRQAMSDLLPEKNSSRTKLGFPVPTDNWLQGPLSEWCEDLLMSEDTGEYFNHNQVKQLLKNHRHTGGYGRKLWTLLTFMAWKHVMIDSV